MKSFNQIAFLLSFAICGTVSAMEEEVPAKFGRWSIELDNKVVEYYAGSNICYYGEYHSQQRDNNIVSFPVECTDPLPIEYCGDKRFFVTSATTGSTTGHPGVAWTILDPAIKQLAVVRCAAQSNGYKTHVYLGLDTDNFKSVGYKSCNRIYSARVMTMDVKTQAGIYACDGRSDRTYYSMPNEVALFGTRDIALQVDNFFPKEEQEDTGNRRRKRVMPGLKWQNPLFQGQVKELLGERRAKDFNFETGNFVSRECYWTQKENKLKGITYNSAKK